METLASRIARQGALNTTDAVGWIVRLARSIERLHARDAVHGRISPHCLLIETGDCTSAGALIDPEQAPELLAYHSPERTVGVPGAVSDDTWALAATLFEALTGKPAFQGATETEVRAQIASVRPALPASVGVRRDKMQAILDRAFSRGWLERTRDVSTLRRELEALRPDIRFTALPPLAEPGKAPAAAARASAARDDDDGPTVTKPGRAERPVAPVEDPAEDYDEDDVPTSVAKLPVPVESLRRQSPPAQKPPLEKTGSPAGGPKDAAGVDWNFKALRGRLLDPKPGSAPPPASARSGPAPSRLAPAPPPSAPGAAVPPSARPAPASARPAQATEPVAPASVRSAPAAPAPARSRVDSQPSIQVTALTAAGGGAAPAIQTSSPLEADSQPTIQASSLLDADSQPTIQASSLLEADSQPTIQASSLLDEAEPPPARAGAARPGAAERPAPPSAPAAPGPASSRRQLPTHTELLAVPLPLPPAEATEPAPAAPPSPAPSSEKVAKAKPAPPKDTSSDLQPLLKDMVPPEPPPRAKRAAPPPAPVAEPVEPPASRRGARTGLVLFGVVLIAGAAAAGTVAFLRTKYPSVRVPGLGGPVATATASAAPAEGSSATAIPAPTAAASDVTAAGSSSAAAPDAAVDAGVAAADASVAAADASVAAADASVAPASPAEINACLRQLFASDTFLPDKGMPDLAPLCEETDPRRGGALFKTQVVRASGGRISEGMREWAILGWYEMAAFGVMRARCCPSPAPLKLPMTTGPCDPLDQQLNELGAAVLAATDTNDPKLKVALDQYTKSVYCAVRMGTTGNFPWKDQLQGGEDAAFLKTLVRAVGLNH